MNFINEHVSSNFYSRQLFFNTPYLTNSKNQLARINVAGHVFINEIHRVVFPHFRVILRTDRPMALCQTKGLSTREAGRGHATPHMPVETAKCWWLLKIESNAWAGGNGSCAVCVGLQAVGALEFFGELYSLAKGFGPFLRGVWAGFREREGSIFSNHQHFAVSTGICGVACPLPASRVDKPLARPFPQLQKRERVGNARLSAHYQF